MSVRQIREWTIVYWHLVGASLKARFAYKFNYVTSVAMQMVLNFSELAVVLLIVHRVHSIGGWSADDITFLFGLVVFSSGVYRIFASEFHDFDKYLVDGEFDAVLTRPAPALVTVMARSIDLEHAGRLLQGVLVLCVEFVRLRGALHFSAFTLVEISYAIVCGALIWLAMVIAVATVGFWTTRIDELQPVFLYGPETATSYPIQIYPKVVQLVFYTIMPVGFGSFVPADLILHKGLPSWMWGLTGVAAVISMGLATVFWSTGVRRYTSTGT